MTTPPAAGIDVSKHRLDLCLLPSGEARSVDNSPQGIEEVVQHFRGRGLLRIAVESTGGYERALLVRLLEEGLPVALVNPRPVRCFAKALGLLAKTDQIDAAVLARFAAQIQPRLSADPGANARALKELVGRRRQVVESLSVQKNQLEHATLAAVRESVLRLIEHHKVELAALEALIDQHLQLEPALVARFEKLQEVRGVGPGTARVLVTDLPELGQASRQKIAALVGVAPMHRPSGDHDGPRHLQGGRLVVRCALYMATLTATRANPVIKAHYQHLRQAGKPRKVAITACMRKLLIHLNAILSDRSDPQHA